VVVAADAADRLPVLLSDVLPGRLGEHGEFGRLIGERDRVLDGYERVTLNASVGWVMWVPPPGHAVFFAVDLDVHQVLQFGRGRGRVVGDDGYDR